MKLLLQSIANFFRNDGPLLAGSIACFFLLSFIPFCLLLITIFGYFLGENQTFYEFLSTRLTSFLPAATFQISQELAALVIYRKIGIITFIIYAFFSYQLYMAVETAVHAIFREKVEKSLIISIIKSFAITTLIAVFIVFSFGATSAVLMLKPIIARFTGLEIGIITGFIIRFVIPVFLVFLITTTLYVLLPLDRPTLRSALWGGLFTTLFLEAARHLFTIYIIAVAGQYGVIYGPLSSFIIFLLWVFYSACIFLLGAEIVSSIKRYGRKKA